ncbi:type 4 pilus major pilin [Serratia symbiotica]|uniref:Conjugal transfer protein n=1 Tax=Serratia symbiotica TaxID=138074 RepID=A0A7D5SN63_9GAMM|nr:type 4 pilus major pilin [Serratia symbiotica]MBF1995202.1 conjugal transfer protein [Serratia symbiotica]MBQ0956874.1 conjugal transfer protein [Serratia symbiotica]QLH62377.1 conjugal transfer protein [Serratia symbiotica]QLH64536.1 conjugal transfer protein [Serratia symbiotica]QTP13585.1 conjugal transfer protein [Serratia symbiotica]
MKTLKKGISNITDAIAALGIMIVVIGLVVAAAALAYFYVNSTSEVTLLTTVMNETRNLRSSSGYGTDDYVPALVKGGSISRSYTVSDNRIYNKSGGQITVVGNGVGFTVTDSQLQQRDCVKVAKSLGTADLLSTKINTTTFTTEVTGAGAATACIDGDNTLTFTTKS